MEEIKLNEWKKNVVFICIIFILICIIGFFIFRECRQKTGIENDIERIDTTTGELQANTEDLRTENIRLRTELETSGNTINRIQSNYNELEKRYQSIMEIMGANENIYVELGENTDLLSEENRKFEGNIEQLKKIFAELVY